jgi:hypothetical protein
MALRWATKDPDEKLDFSIDFSDRMSSTDSIASVTWTVPAGLTNVSVSNTSFIATIVLSGGTVDTQYQVSAKVTTTDGFILEQEVIEKIRTRQQGAMTITVENGTGLSTANTYVSENDATTYHLDRDNDDWHAYSGTEDKEAALVRATAAIDGMFRSSFPGYKKLSRDQSLEWPRSYAYDIEGNLIDSDSLPRELVQATCEAALRELQDPGCMAPDLERGGDVRRMKAGSVEIEYGAGSQARTAYTILAQILGPILTQNATSSMFGSSSRG